MLVYRFEFHTHFSADSVSTLKQHRFSYYVSCAKITVARFCHVGCYSLDDMCSSKGALRNNLQISFSSSNEHVYNQIRLNPATFEPLVATTFGKRPPLLRDQISQTPKVFKSNHNIWNLLNTATSCK